MTTDCDHYWKKKKTQAQRYIILSETKEQVRAVV